MKVYQQLYYNKPFCQNHKYNYTAPFPSQLTLSLTLQIMEFLNLYEMSIWVFKWAIHSVPNQNMTQACFFQETSGQVSHKNLR